jgi:hypothetical protein
MEHGPTPDVSLGPAMSRYSGLGGSGPPARHLAKKGVQDCGDRGEDGIRRMRKPTPL